MKAPLLKQQKDDLEGARDVNQKLRDQLSQAADEQQAIRGEKDTVARELIYTRAELERYQRDCADLSSQARSSSLRDCAP